jgi:NTP pyrophosphatase (non-canonical NTP hydrolase)
MNSQEYNQSVQRTASGAFYHPDPILLHGAIGIATEAGEILDAFKKEMYYGKDIDKVNLMEELGDVCWYISLILYQMGWTWEQIWQANIDKLKKRYPQKFTEEHAVTRDIEAERKPIIDIYNSNKS